MFTTGNWPGKYTSPTTSLPCVTPSLYLSQTHLWVSLTEVKGGGVELNMSDANNAVNRLITDHTGDNRLWQGDGEGRRRA